VAVALADHELLKALDLDELERLLPNLGTLSIAAGAAAVQAGDLAAEVFLVTRGCLSVIAPGDEVPTRRLSTLSAGMTFGEVGYVERGARTADVYADTDVECTTLPYAVLDRLASTDPRLHGKLLYALARVVVSSLRVANAEAAQLTR